MTTSESKCRFFSENESIRIDSNRELECFSVGCVRQVAVVYVLAVLFNVPRFFQYSVIYSREGGGAGAMVPHKRLTPMGASSGYDIFYLNVFHTAVLFILPLVVLVIINAIIIRELQVAKANMQSRSIRYIGSVAAEFRPLHGPDPTRPHKPRGLLSETGADPTDFVGDPGSTRVSDAGADLGGD